MRIKLRVRKDKAQEKQKDKFKNLSIEKISGDEALPTAPSGLEQP
jgi:hypothetical protein